MHSFPAFASSRPVVLQPYQPTWPHEFATLAQRLRGAAGPGILEINHIGSTAVPGLCAKDVLDVQLQVADIAGAVSLTRQLRTAGFQKGESMTYDVFHELPIHSPELYKFYMREPVGERRMAPTYSRGGSVQRSLRATLSRLSAGPTFSPERIW